MIYRDWHVGMKVVCVKRGEWSGGSLAECVPAYGEVYTVRTMEDTPEGLFLRLHELSNPECFGTEPQFWAVRFRPVETRKTDISIFTSMLSPERGKVEA